MIVSNIAALKALTGTDKINGMALTVTSEYAWFIFDVTSTETGDDVTVITPTDGTGRWIKANNNSDVFNDVQIVVTSDSTTDIDNTYVSGAIVVLNQSTSLTFNTTLRNGLFTVLLNRNGGAWTISGWDSRILWGTSSPYTFSTGLITKAILQFLVFDDDIYFVNVKEF